jgi:hypothetical protein
MLNRNCTRRELFADVGRGMFLAGLGLGLARDLGLSPAWAAEEPNSLTFGDLEPLVDFMRDTPPEKILPGAIAKIQSGTDLKTLVAAAALANARAFGGEDYVGFHTLMALPPAFHMAAEEKRESHKALPILKVLVRNATRLQEFGPTKETLKPVKPGKVEGKGGEQLREAVRDINLERAEATFAAIAQGSPEDALNDLLVMVDDATEVHRVVLVSRAWELTDYVGRERAHTMLRQSVHYCVKGEKSSAKSHAELRTILPKLLDEHHLLGRPASKRPADDAWVASFADTMLKSTPAKAAEAAAMALAESIDPIALGEALALASNQLVLRDPGRPKEWAQPNKPVGSVHGDSVGVHSCDAINAWRHLAQAGDQRTRVTSLIIAAYQVARDCGGRLVKYEPYPRPEHLEKVKATTSESLLAELDAAIRDKDQPRSAAIAHRLGEVKVDPASVFGLLRDFAVSEDGALHAEKFYRTTSEEFAASRPAFRWRQLVALARVTASAYGYPAPGFKDACGLLKAT